MQVRPVHEIVTRMDSDAYDWRFTGDLEEFLERAGAFLRSRPALHTVQLTVADKLRTEGLSALGGQPPYFGWLSTVLPGYEPTTLSLAANVHTQPVGERPLVELEHTDHPLAVEQRTGITLARVQEIAEVVGHASH